MRKLIGSGFRIMFRHSRFIWITMVVSAMLGALGGFFGCMPENLDQYRYEPGMLYLSILPVLLLILFSLVFAVGQEMGGGTIRNKLIAGCSKTSVCFAWLVCSLVFAAVCAALYLTPFMLLSQKALGILPAGVQCRFVLTLLLLFLTVGAAGGLFSLLFRRQAAAAFLSVTAAMLLYFGAAFMTSQLARVKYNETRVMKYTDPATGKAAEEQTDAISDLTFVRREDEDGNPQERVIAHVVTVFNPNPYYVDSPLRETCIILNKLNPANALLDSVSVLDSISTGHELSRLKTSRESFIASAKETLKSLEGSAEPGDDIHRLRVSAELTEWETGYIVHEIEMLERDYRTAAEGTEGVPRCLLGVLLAFCAAGIGIFRKKDIV